MGHIDQPQDLTAALRVIVNGAARDLPAQASVLDVARLLGIADDQMGVAIACAGIVVRRADWSTTKLSDDDHVEVVRAAAGG